MSVNKHRDEWASEETSLTLANYDVTHVPRVDASPRRSNKTFMGATEPDPESNPPVPDTTDLDTCDNNSVTGVCNRHGEIKKLTGLFLKCSALILLWIYVGFVLFLNPGKSALVCIVTPCVTLYIVDRLAHGRLTQVVWGWRDQVLGSLTFGDKLASRVRLLSTVLAVSGIAVFLTIDIWGSWEKCIPLGGLAALVGLSVLASTNPSKINWMTVIWGLILQITLGLLILRWRPGFEACQFLGHQITVLLDYTDVGSEFIFGKKYTYHPVVFKILPTIIFFSSVVSILYYMGAMQAVIKSIALVLQFFLNVTPIESFATAAHIFIGQPESSVALKPFWDKLTDSELHAIITSGFATVAGMIIGAYVEFGVPAEHVISASFMSAPAALAVAKISFPETETSQIKTQKEIKIDAGHESNLIEALSVGATASIKLISFIVVNIIAFIAVCGFLDATLSYLGSLVNCPQLSFQLVCSYVFMPLAAMMGVPWGETGIVGAMIGKKIFVNEFLSYADLGAMLKAGQISDRAAVLTTYILCGFGSISSLGVNLGSLTSAAPEMRSKFASLILRAMINGNVACFMTACVAGLLYQDLEHPGTQEAEFNTTTSRYNTSTFQTN